MDSAEREAAPPTGVDRGGPRPFTLKVGAFFFRYRDYLFPLVIVAVLGVGIPPALERSFGWSGAVMGLGAVVALAGEALRLWVIGYAYIARGGKDGKAYAEDLVVKGLFAHCRHPLYTGNLAIALGLSLMFGTWFSTFVVIPFFLFVYHAMASNEEAFLRGKFGAQYEAYSKTVPRFIPDWRGLQASLAPFVYDWRRALRKDYGQIALTVGLALAIAGWRTRVAFPGLVPWTWGAFGALVVAYVVVRTLKLRGRLESE